MAIHEEFESAIIRTALGETSLGETSEAEYAALKAHLEGCEDCRLLADQYRALARRDLPLLHDQYGSKEPLTEKNTDNNKEKATARRARFLEAAGQKGFHFSPGMAHLRPAACSFLPLLAVERVAVPLVLLGLVAGTGVYVARRHSRNLSAQIVSLERQLDDAHQALASSQESVESSTASQQSTRTEINRLRDQVELLEKQLASIQSELSQQTRTGALLHQAADEKDSRLRVADQKLVELQSSLAEAKSENQSLRDQRRSDEAVALIEQKRFDELTRDLQGKDALINQTKQLMSADRDIRDLMGARQLHIVDVFDADANGKRQKRFGRVFYTEGKSLVFYAFDLAKPGIVEAKQSFQAWGTKYGASNEAVSLGMFYLDDKSQSRWALKVDDPALLSEIDSVFVTAEPSRDGKKPTGRRVLFAFLRNPANHP